MESNYGATLANPKLVKNTIRSLATLAYSGGRLSKFGRQQLVVALKIVQRGDVTRRRHDRLMGRRHGPHAVHPDDLQRLCRRLSTATATATSGRRRRTRWLRPPTISRASGWQAGKTWGYEVTLPKGFTTKAMKDRSVGEWRKLGVRRIGGKAFPPRFRPGRALSPVRQQGAGLPAPQELPCDQALQQCRPPMRWRSGIFPTACAAMALSRCLGRARRNP